MIETIKRHQDEIERVCRNFGVRRLEAFGSATGEDFVEGESDVDFIVEFDDDGPESGLLSRYLHLNDELEQLLGVHVDLITPQSVKNKYFQKTVNESRESVYER